MAKGVSPENSRKQKRNRARDYEVEHEPSLLAERFDQEFCRDVLRRREEFDAALGALKNDRRSAVMLKAALSTSAPPLLARIW